MPDDASKLAGEPPIETRWDHRLGHVLWETYARMSAIGEAEFADSSLSMPGTGALDVVAELPGSTVSELARRSAKTQQALSQVVARLERLGYVERRLGAGRGVGLHITPAGEQARRDGHARELAIERRLHDALGPTLYEELRSRLDEARTALDPTPD